ncbi:hypothetical protein LMG22037_05528 [Paraburkholderia phenoliruptrix]|uniref:Uncharacterized protein n=1 Tax=Paraburkholderia phenoliruptrix TaxID=252970 RepID=A0A6J5CBJ4_9BURK|nr:hypothetical protein [Paraburkholderia phenoliruptrix]CAB3730411.1 hypothetical protein LMG22037_05528 [Paraburkholderia phenoliruptrix]
MTIRALLPVVATRGIKRDTPSVQATLIFTHVQPDSRAKMRPVHLYSSAGAEVIYALVDGVAGALRALDAQRLGTARAAIDIRDLFCTAARAHTHVDDASILASSLSDPLDSMLDLYGSVGQGVYVFSGGGMLIARRSSLSPFDNAPLGDTDLLGISAHPGLTDRFLDVRQNACRTTIEILTARRRMSAATKEKLMSLLIDATALAPLNPSFPSSQSLTRLNACAGVRLDQNVRRLPKGAQTSGGRTGRTNVSAVSMDW